MIKNPLGSKQRKQYRINSKSDRVHKIKYL